MASSYYKMKGIFKGFRIISNIFAAKEPEMEIGRPTDVKHVAHIGWNSSTGTLTGNAPPSWVNIYAHAPWSKYQCKLWFLLHDDEPEFCTLNSAFFWSQMNGLGGSSSDLSSLANFALAAPSAATSWASQGT
uniref:Uncharacterized protein n=1 Tax=Avena sativa TaxID=4498 RepID=A0ACD5V3F8_AVESA